jgi:hypothetical protein
MNDVFVCIGIVIGAAATASLFAYATCEWALRTRRW